MNAFETPAVIDDSKHLVLRDPLPRPAGQACRVIVLFEDAEDATATSWPTGYFDEIRITDPAFERQPQGVAPAIAPLDA